MLTCLFKAEKLAKGEQRKLYSKHFDWEFQKKHNLKYNNRLTMFYNYRIGLLISDAISHLTCLERDLIQDHSPFLIATQSSITVVRHTVSDDNIYLNSQTEGQMQVHTVTHSLSLILAQTHTCLLFSPFYTWDYWWNIFCPRSKAAGWEYWCDDVGVNNGEIAHRFQSSEVSSTLRLRARSQ